MFAQSCDNKVQPFSLREYNNLDFEENVHASENSNSFYEDNEYHVITGGSDGTWVSERMNNKTETPSFRETQCTMVVAVEKVVNVAKPEAFGKISMISRRVLTGEVREIPLEAGSEELQKNIATAKKIVRFVQGRVPFSANYPIRSEGIRAMTNPSHSLAMKKYFADCLKLVRAVPAKTPFINRATAAEEEKVGNCAEMCYVGARYANVPIEIANIDEGDHVFLIIGRDRGALPSVYKEWGPDAVVCCPWTGACFPASEIENYLRDYIGCATVNGMGGYPMVKPFDPSFQTINIIYSSPMVAT